MIRGEELAYSALKKEFNRLDRAFNRATSEYDEYMNVHHEMIAIHRELAEIVKSKELGAPVLKKLNALKKRSDNCERIRKKDLTKLMDKHIQLQLDRDSIGHEMQLMEFRCGLKGRNIKQAGRG